jgi:hypothetical protein
MEKKTGAAIRSEHSSRKEPQHFHKRMRKKEKEIGGPHPEAHHRALGRVPIGMESEHVSK